MDVVWLSVTPSRLVTLATSWVHLLVFAVASFIPGVGTGQRRPFALGILLTNAFFFFPSSRYIERKAFLERVDHRQFEIERDLRLSKMKP